MHHNTHQVPFPFLQQVLKLIVVKFQYYILFDTKDIKMVSVSEIRKAQRAEGPATILAIGTANPANCVEQSTYPDFYFKITNSEHKTELKEKFQRMCKHSSPLFNILIYWSIQIFLDTFRLHLSCSLCDWFWYILPKNPCANVIPL